MHLLKHHSKKLFHMECDGFCIDSTSLPGMCYVIDFIDTVRTVSNFTRKTKLLSSFLKQEIDLVIFKITEFLFRSVIFHGIFSAVPRCISIALNRYWVPKKWAQNFKNFTNFLNFNQFNNCPFFLANYFMNLFSCLAWKRS